MMTKIKNMLKKALWLFQSAFFVFEILICLLYEPPTDGCSKTFGLAF